MLQELSSLLGEKSASAPTALPLAPPTAQSVPLSATITPPFGTPSWPYAADQPRTSVSSVSSSYERVAPLSLYPPQGSGLESYRASFSDVAPSQQPQYSDVPLSPCTLDPAAAGDAFSAPFSALPAVAEPLTLPTPAEPVHPAAKLAPKDEGAELHSVVHLLSITHNRRVRLEVTCPDADPHVPSLVPVYPTSDWHERETYDFFGIIFDGHPSLTRIEMPDDWHGHPQRKDYPLGGIPVEYKGAEIPPPDQRRAYN